MGVRTSKAASTSLLLGILGLLTIGITGIPAVVCGHLALRKIKTQGGALAGRGLAIAGLVAGYFFTTVFALAVLSTPVILKQAKLRALVNAGSNADSTPLSAGNPPLSAGVHILPLTEAKEEFPDEIGFYQKNGPSAYKIQWQISLDGNHWGDIRTTKHQVYVTRTAPAATVAWRRETLFHLACESAPASGTDQAIVDAVWDKFDNFPIGSASPEIRAVNQITGNRDGSEIKFRPDSDLWDNYQGTCAAWAMALQQAVAINGVQVNLCDLSCKAFEHPSYPSSNYTIDPGSRAWHVKEQEKNAESTAYNITTPADKMNRGQGGMHNQRAWSGHTIIEYNGAYYDPSYGIKGASQIDYEDRSIQGYSYNYTGTGFYILFYGDFVFDRTIGGPALLNYTNRYK